MVRSNLARFRGKEVKTTGDGFLATFDGPARAIRAAQAVRAELAEHGLQVRVGLHTREVELVAGAGFAFTDCGTHQLKGIPERCRSTRSSQPNAS